MEEFKSDQIRAFRYWIQGYVAAHSLTTLFYLIQKGKSSAEARAAIT